MKSLSPATESVDPLINSLPSAGEFEDECVAFFGEIVQLFGVSASVGNIYGLLYASPYPLSFSDIVESLDSSKGSVSQGLNLLRSLGAVHTVNPENAISRREYYTPELSLRRLMRGILDERLGPLGSRSAIRLKRLRVLASAEDKDVRKFKLSRVHQLEIWRRRMKAVVPVVGSFLGPKRRK